MHGMYQRIAVRQYWIPLVTSHAGRRRCWGHLQIYTSCLGNIRTADCRVDKDIKKQYSRKNAVGNMLVRKFSIAPIEEKIKLFKSYCYPIYGCHFGVIDSRTLLENLLSVIVTQSSVLLTSPKHQLESGFCDERNWSYQCGVTQICIQLDEQSGSFANSIVTAIFNSDAYHQSTLMDKSESVLYV